MRGDANVVEHEYCSGYLKDEDETETMIQPMHHVCTPTQEEEI